MLQAQRFTILWSVFGPAKIAFLSNNCVSPQPQLFNVSKPRITQSRVQGVGHQRYSDPHNIENQGRVFVIVSHRPGGPPEEGAARGTPWGPNYIVTPPIGECCNVPTAVYQVYNHASRALLLILNTLIRSSLSTQPVRPKNSFEGLRVFSIYRC